MHPSGEVMYSNAWMERVGEEIPLPYRNVCRNICKAYTLGNDKDILMIWDEIQKELPTFEQEAIKEYINKWG